MPAIIAQTIDLSQWTPGEDGKVRGKDKPGNLGGGPTIFVDDFSDGLPFYQINPASTDPQYRDLWNQYAPATNGDCIFSIDPIETINGKSVLVQSMGASQASYNGQLRWPGPYLQLYTHTGQRWQYLDYLLESILTRGKWEYDTFNRMEMYVKFPDYDVYPEDLPHLRSFDIGTYYSSRAAGGPSSNSAEVGGDHPYHIYNLSPGWNRLVLDTHPHHFRGQPGDYEHGDQEYISENDAPFGGQMYNYFDLITRLYFRVNQDRVLKGNGVWKWGPIRLYHDPNDNNIANIHSMSGNYQQSTNQLTLAWSVHKQLAVNVEVRYSFFSIRQVGWDNALPAPNGILARTGYGGHAGMRYRTTGINVSGQTRIYFAVRPVGDADFAEFMLPLNMGNS